jgi:hypothetical protein
MNACRLQASSIRRHSCKRVRQYLHADALPYTPKPSNTYTYIPVLSSIPQYPHVGRCVYTPTSHQVFTRPRVHLRSVDEHNWTDMHTHLRAFNILRVHTFTFDPSMHTHGQTRLHTPTSLQIFTRPHRTSRTTSNITQRWH